MTEQFGSERSHRRPSAARGWWTVLVLAAALTLALMDRMIIALMIGPIKHDLGLTDTQISMVQGMAFTLTYVAAGLPLGRLADRGNRVKLAATCVVFWSIMTALCGRATSFPLLLLARLGVGVGEAGISPAAFSLVTDYFPTERRTKPLAFLTIGTTAGAGLSMMTGGLIIQAVGRSGYTRFPLVGQLHGWQIVFLILGGTGLAFTALLLTIREPLRVERTSSEPTIAVVASFLLGRWRYFLPQFLGPALSVLTLISFHSWMPTMLIRRYGLGIGEAGLSYGTLIMVSGCVGVASSGWLSERLTHRGVPDAPNLVASYSAAGAVPFLIAGPLMPSTGAALMMLFAGLALVAVPSTLAPAAFQDRVPNEMRGQTFAVYLLIMSLLGYALGPLLVAVTTDRILGNEQQVHISLALVAGLIMPFSIVSLIAARRAGSKLLDRNLNALGG